MPVEPNPKNAMAFVDGQNLFQHAKDAFGHHHPNYDLVKLHKRVCEANNWRPTLVRFYTGVPPQHADQMWHGYWQKRKLSMIRDGIIVTTRDLRYRTRDAYNENGELGPITIPQEKGIDIRIALDLVSLARLRQYDVAVIYSQDQDLAEVVKEIREISEEQNRWIKVACAFPHSTTASASRGIDKTDWFRMSRDLYDECLDARDYRPKPGS